MKRVIHHKVSIVFSVLLFAACPVIAGHAFAIAIDNQLTTIDPLASSGCTPPESKTSFSPTDEAVYFWVSVTDTSVGDVIEWRWFSPDNAPYAHSRFNLHSLLAAPAVPGHGSTSMVSRLRTLRDNGALRSISTELLRSPATSLSVPVPPPPPSDTIAGAAQLAFSVNDQILVPWGYVDLSYRIKSFQPGLRVDLYLALLVENQVFLFMGPGLVLTPTLTPFATDLALSNTQPVIIAGHLGGQVNPLAMTLYGVLVPRGTSPLDPANWISNLASLDLALGPLSSRQVEVIAERGNPQAYVIEFFHDIKLRIETWVYEGEGLGNVFQFINGRSLPSDGNERLPATIVAPAVLYDPGRFGPATTPGEVRSFLGDPDRVVSNSPGTQAWLYKGSDITVTVQNGVIRQIEAH